MPPSKKFVPGQIMTKDGNGIRLTGVLISQDVKGNEMNDNVDPTFGLMKMMNGGQTGMKDQDKNFFVIFEVILSKIFK